MLFPSALLLRALLALVITCWFLHVSGSHDVSSHLRILSPLCQFLKSGSKIDFRLLCDLNDCSCRRTFGVFVSFLILFGHGSLGECQVPDDIWATRCTHLRFIGVGILLLTSKFDRLAIAVHHNVVDDLSKLLSMPLGLDSLHLLFVVNLAIYSLLDLLVKLHVADALLNIPTFSHNLMVCRIRASIQSMSDIIKGLPRFLLVLFDVFL